MAPGEAKSVPLTCHGHSRPVTHLSFSAVTDDEQYYLVSACKDNNPMIRDGVTGDWIGTFIGHKGAVWQARLSSDATLAATASADFTAKVWDCQTGEALHTLQHNHIVRAVAFPPQPNPQLLATGGAEKKLRIFDLSNSHTSQTASLTSTSPATTNPLQSNGAPTGTSSDAPPTPPLYEIGPGIHTATIKSILWTPDDPNILITACDDKKLRWWDLRTRDVVAEYTVDGTIGSCELNTVTATHPTTASPADALAAAASDAILSVAAGSHVYFFSGSGRGPLGQLIVSHKLPHEVASVALNTHERKFVAGSASDTWVHQYSFDSGEELELGKGHHGPIWSLSFSPDARLYATGSEDGTIKLWKFGAGGYGLWR